MQLHANGLPAIPHHYADAANQQRILRHGMRGQLIDWLTWNDPNGCYTDADSAAEGKEPLTLEEARNIMSRQIAD